MASPAVPAASTGGGTRTGHYFVVWRPTNPRWWTAAILKKKPLNRHISAIVRPILMKFDTVTHIGPWQRIDR